MLESEVLSVTTLNRDSQWPQLHTWILDEFWAEVCLRST